MSSFGKTLILLFLFLLPISLAADANLYQLERRCADVQFSRPLGFYPLPKTQNKALLLEQGGRGLMLEDFRGNCKTYQFLDLSSKVSTRGWEQGLLGFAFHPEYSSTKLVFVYYTDLAGSVVVSSLKVEKDSVDLKSEKTVLVVEQPYANHNGGQIAFGPDGYLYIGLGDGGAAGDPHRHGQNPGTLLGSLLRIDVNTSKKPYEIPKDNPFVRRTGFRPEAFAIGLRNPWRFSFDSQTKKLWLADVGQDRFEEINIIRPGGNYGWRKVEGPECFRPSRNCEKASYISPVHAYGRAKGGSVTGGYVYRGKKLPVLHGKYVFGDFLSGKVWALDTQGTLQPKEILSTGRNISSFGQTADGELIVLSHRKGELLEIRKL